MAAVAGRSTGSLASMKDDADRSTAHGFWRFAANYLLAAREVRRKLDTDGKLLFPTIHLYSMVIELALKAFLLKRGDSLEQIRALSHNLEGALKRARRRKLGLLVKLSRFDAGAIRSANITYSRHETRYIRTGSTRVPTISYLAGAAERLVAGLEQFCTGQRGRI
jgi:hypothetical protein